MTFTAPSLSGPDGLAFDARGNLFVANSNGNSITEFLAGATPGTFGAGTVVETGLSDPRGLAFDARGDLFAANQEGGSNGQGSITEFLAGASPGTFGATTTLTAISLDNPNGVAVDSRGDLFAASLSNNSIIEFASTGPGTFGVAQTVETGLSGPVGVAFGPSSPVPEASTTASFGLLLALGMGGVAGAARKKRKA